MRIISDPKLDFSDVLFVPKRSKLKSRSEVKLDKHYTMLNSGIARSFVPIIAANMDGVGTFEMCAALNKHGCQTALTKHYSAQEYIDFYNTPNDPIQPNPWVGAIYSLGITADDTDKYKQVLNSINSDKVHSVCIDVANGYTQRFIDFCKRFRDDNPNKIIIAGNVVTPEITEELIMSGVDIVKVGIGSGAQCLTRVQTGVGYPQLSAVIECADAAHGLGGHIISDGGCVNVGDIAKAFGAGADFVMLGSMLAGHSEGNSKISDDGEIEFYGMSSESARAKHNEGKEYRSSEGRTTLIPFKGSVYKTIQDILGGLRSTCTYVGATSLKELPKRTTFIMVGDTHNRSHEQFTIGK